MEKETLVQVFSWAFCEISRNTFFTEHLWWLLLFEIPWRFYGEHFELEQRRSQKEKVLALCLYNSTWCLIWLTDIDKSKKILVNYFPGHIIPQGILEVSIKITNEPPTGMMANVHKSLDNFTQVCSNISRRTRQCSAIIVITRENIFSFDLYFEIFIMLIDPFPLLSKYFSGKRKLIWHHKRNSDWKMLTKFTVIYMYPFWDGFTLTGANCRLN